MNEAERPCAMEQQAIREASDELLDRLLGLTPPAAAAPPRTQDRTEGYLRRDAAVAPENQDPLSDIRTQLATIQDLCSRRPGNWEVALQVIQATTQNCDGFLTGDPLLSFVSILNTTSAISSVLPGGGAVSMAIQLVCLLLNKGLARCNPAQSPDATRQIQQMLDRVTRQQININCMTYYDSFRADLDRLRFFAEAENPTEHELGNLASLHHHGHGGELHSTLSTYIDSNLATDDNAGHVAECICFLAKSGLERLTFNSLLETAQRRHEDNIEAEVTVRYTNNLREGLKQKFERYLCTFSPDHRHVYAALHRLPAADRASLSRIMNLLGCRAMDGELCYVSNGNQKLQVEERQMREGHRYVREESATRGSCFRKFYNPPNQDTYFELLHVHTGNFLTTREKDTYVSEIPWLPVKDSLCVGTGGRNEHKTFQMLQGHLLMPELRKKEEEQEEEEQEEENNAILQRYNVILQKYLFFERKRAKLFTRQTCFQKGQYHEIAAGGWVLTPVNFDDDIQF